jgi:hypothetical protein
MKRITLILCTVFFGSLLGAFSAFAYGGGGGFSNGYFENPHSKINIECRLVSIGLPWSELSVSFPKCSIAIIEIKKTEKNLSLKNRINDFFYRVKNGGR